jgi:hypothetical protein
MAIDEKTKIEYSDSELQVLNQLMTYVERMLFEEQDNSYSPLRRHAYGKTVVIETESKGLLTFRLSSCSTTVPVSGINLATPHSPVGRLCAFLRPGYEGESPAWGEYVVKEVRLFDRFDGIKFDQNIRNFLKMSIEGDNGTDYVVDLKAFIEKKSNIQYENDSITDKSANDDTVPSVILKDNKPEIVGSIFVDDEEDTPWLPFEVDNNEDATQNQVNIAEEYYGLNEIFYINRTRDQDKIISRSPFGPMFVEGVAGSGKTSAALGRTKMLCDFKTNNVVTEQDFINIAGTNIDYWDGKYAGQFTQEGSIGFVRTGELIQYLKETCRRIDLPNLPVTEYGELQSRLRNHRNIQKSLMPGVKWAYLPESRDTYQDTTMEWLYAADKNIALYYRDYLIESISTTEKFTDTFAQEHQSTIELLSKSATSYFQSTLHAVINQVTKSNNLSKFQLEGVAQKVHEIIENTRRTVLEKDTFWFISQDIFIFSQTEREMAVKLLEIGIPLFIRQNDSAIRIADLDTIKKERSGIQLYTEDHRLLTWGNEAKNLLNENKLFVKDTFGRFFVLKLIDIDDLYLKLLPESNERIYVYEGDKLKKITLLRGLGKRKFKLRQESQKAIDSEDNIIEKERSFDAEFTRRVRQKFIGIMSFVVDAYAATLSNTLYDYPEPDLVKDINLQLQQKKLTSADIDLLLCIYHLIGKGYSGSISTLREPDYYQSVFIDEAQDFTEQQIFLMAEQARTQYRAVTVVGDVAQKLHNDHKINIANCFPSKNISHIKLKENLRQIECPGLAWFSACYRGLLQEDQFEIEPDENIKDSLRKNISSIGGPEIFFITSQDEFDEELIDSLRNTPNHHTVAVIFPTQEIALENYNRLRPVLSESMIDCEISEKVDLSRRYIKHFTSILNTKGLEFDTVILANIEKYDLNLFSQRNRLYVGITRARKRLIITTHCETDPKLDLVLSRYEQVISDL